MGSIDFGQILLLFPVFLLALTVHECAHALTANWGGDLTATYQKRLSLNPLVHIDPIGTILVPIISMASGFILFGWARPVPVNEENFRDKAWNVIVSLAGPFSNFLLVVFGTLLFGLLFRVINLAVAGGVWSPSERVIDAITTFAFYFVAINWILCLFNLIPVPPLDGSHVLYHFVVRGRGRLYPFWDIYSRIGFFALLLLFWTGAGGILGKLAMTLSMLSCHLLGFPPPLPNL